MSKDLDALTYIIDNPTVAGFSIGQSAFDYYAGLKAYKKKKKQIKQQQDVLRTQAELEKAGIQIQTYLTKQTLTQEADDRNTQALKRGAVQVQEAASIGATGEALSMIAQNEAAKRARQAAIVDGQIDITTAEGMRKQETVDITTKARVDSLWSQLSGKPSVLGSVIKSAAQVYQSYKAETKDRAKLDAMMGAGKHGSSFSSDISIKDTQSSVESDTTIATTEQAELSSDIDTKVTSTDTLQVKIK